MAGYYPEHEVLTFALRDPVRMARLDARRAKPSQRTPCPCCQELPPTRFHKLYRPKDEVCDTCLIKLWRAEDAIVAEQVRLNSSDLDLIAVSRLWPSIDRPRSNGAADPIKQLETLVRGFFRALTADRIERAHDTGLGTPEIRGYQIKANPRSAPNMTDALMVTVPPGSRELVERLPVELGKLVAAIYEAGIDHGANMLARLATGEITLDDFDSRGRSTEKR